MRAVQCLDALQFVGHRSFDDKIEKVDFEKIPMMDSKRLLESNIQTGEGASCRKFHFVNSLVKKSAQRVLNGESLAHDQTIDGVESLLINGNGWQITVHRHQQSTPFPMILSSMIQSIAALDQRPAFINPESQASFWRRLEARSYFATTVARAFSRMWSKRAESSNTLSRIAAN